MKKMIRNKKAKILTTALAAAMTMSMAAPMVASAHSAYETTPTASMADTLQSIAGVQTDGNTIYVGDMQVYSAAASTAPTAAQQERYRKQKEILEKRKLNNTYVAIANHGNYVVKNWKFYGRKIIGIKENGDYILGKWELLDERNDVNRFSKVTHLDISGEYAQFAFSTDITWGTDYPVSGVFWDYTDRWVFGVEIELSGCCRTVDFSAKVWYHVPERTSYTYEYIKEENCSSHKEWKP